MFDVFRTHQTLKHLYRVDIVIYEARQHVKLTQFILIIHSCVSRNE